jgi:hypothetical protein
MHLIPIVSNEAARAIIANAISGMTKKTIASEINWRAERSSPEAGPWP